jgi:glycosyltransferase involved in cell wall biosynthesis
MDFQEEFEVVVIEDGSTIKCDEVVKSFSRKLNISYFFKPNSGPGDSRNFGMRKAKGDYFIIFDSDCIIPSTYLRSVAEELKSSYCDCFGGPDRALDSFSDIQKAINFAMTSFLTTGGIRGGSEKIDRFQPRSFNMGISKHAFTLSGGFGDIHPGEDPDLSVRLWKLNLTTRLFANCYVYHKRRIDWKKFTTQVNKFGKARPILNSWHPEYVKPTYFIPSLFLIGLCLAIFLAAFSFYGLLCLYLFYFLTIMAYSSAANKSLTIGAMSVLAVWKQFLGYGSGFIEAFFKVTILKKNPRKAFPELFFES